MYVCGLSDRNLIYNNYFNNTNITIKNGTGNAYNTAKASGKNIVGGTYIGGNFWGANLMVQAFPIRQRTRTEMGFPIQHTVFRAAYT